MCFPASGGLCARVVRGAVGLPLLALAVLGPRASAGGVVSPRAAAAPTTVKAATKTAAKTAAKTAKTAKTRTKTVKARPATTRAAAAPTTRPPAPSAPVVVAAVTVPATNLPGGNEETQPSAPDGGATATTAAPASTAAAAPTATAPTGPTAPPTNVPATTVPATTTTVPFPAPAAPPRRPAAATLDPYRGLGSWVDLLDWSVSPTPPKKQTPKFNLPDLDAMAATGVQTLYLQVTRRSHPSDIPEPERLLPIIDRAHQLGMYVVAWYVPGHTDVNLDLRRAVAIANLDIDGITIDIESNALANVDERNRRLVLYSQQLRQLLPGRVVGATVLPPINVDLPNQKLWPRFPYTEIAPFYEVWQIMNYWTDLSAASGWRDSYKYTLENVRRLRERVRPDVPIHLIGGVGDRTNAYDIGVFVRAAQEAGVIGASTYDWIVTPKDSYQYQWAARFTAPGQASDPRFPAAPLPPPTTTTTTTTTTTLPGGAVPAGATVPGAAPAPPPAPAPVPAPAPGTIPATPG